ncbi:MAG: hypothetical protein ACE5I1_07740 [bacterium]
MTVQEALSKTKKIIISPNPLPVEKTCATELAKAIRPGMRIVAGNFDETSEPALMIAVRNDANFPSNAANSLPGAEKPKACFKISPDGNGMLAVSHANLLYAYTHKLINEWSKQPLESFAKGKYFQAAFQWHRPMYDYLLTQVWRTARHFDPESHIREMAKSGCTHLEVNGLAQLLPLEDAVPGEFYSQFYSYCLALDQYVYSELNKGIYPVEYLDANLNLLKKYAHIGKKYGLDPGILCFEPRSVPEKLLQRYPTLRGARVDHPLRSRRPRFNLSLAHPLVQEHYAEMATKLLQEVPELAYMSIWSNDSGAGFEYTSSLYVGRNGGPYLVREWRTHEQIAEAAGKNVVQFMKLIRDAAAKINPDFRVSLRLEPFKVEHDFILENLESQLDIEVPSLLVRGYDLPYHHEKYSNSPGVAGSILHNRLESQEQDLIEKHEKRGIASHLVYSQGNGFNFEPLIGIPFPWLLHQKLQAMHERGVKYAANLGGLTPSSLAPYHINQEIFKAFMLDPEQEIDAMIQQKASEWVGEKASHELIAIWRNAEEAIRYLPPLPLYSGFGFVWLRVWVRPIIPHLLAVPEPDRRYYEDFMVSAANNTNLTDLGRDVLFDLFSKEYGASYVERVDENVLSRLENALALAREHAKKTQEIESVHRVFVDQRDRLHALRCWIGTLRSVAAWVAGVYHYLEAEQDSEEQKWRDYLDEMVSREIENAADLLYLCESSMVDFMVVSKTGETSYIYGENFCELVKRKIELMEKYRYFEPFIDDDILWRI